MSQDAPTVHGTALLVDGCGVLIRGPSGAGKSRLALALLDQAGCHVLPSVVAAQSHQTALIGDDRVVVRAGDGNLFASPPKSIEGTLEVRSIGIVAMPWVSRAQLHLIVDIAPAESINRMPETRSVTVDGCALHHQRVPTGDLAHQVLLVHAAMRLLLTR